MGGEGGNEGGRAGSRREEREERKEERGSEVLEVQLDVLTLGMPVSFLFSTPHITNLCAISTVEGCGRGKGCAGVGMP